MESIIERRFGEHILEISICDLRCAGCQDIASIHLLNENGECVVCAVKRKVRLKAERAYIKSAIASFPETFTLRPLPNRKFRISEHRSVFKNGELILYVECQEDGWWKLYLTATENQLRTQVIPLPENYKPFTLEN